MVVVDIYTLAQTPKHTTHTETQTHTHVYTYTCTYTNMLTEKGESYSAAKDA